MGVFAYKYICTPHEWVLPTEARRRCQTSRTKVRDGSKPPVQVLCKNKGLNTELSFQPQFSSAPMLLCPWSPLQGGRSNEGKIKEYKKFVVLNTNSKNQPS